MSRAFATVAIKGVRNRLRPGQRCSVTFVKLYRSGISSVAGKPLSRAERYR